MDLLKGGRGGGGIPNVMACHCSPGLAFPKAFCFTRTAPFAIMRRRSAPSVTLRHHTGSRRVHTSRECHDSVRTQQSPFRPALWGEGGGSPEINCQTPPVSPPPPPGRPQICLHRRRTTLPAADSSPKLESWQQLPPGPTGDWTHWMACGLVLGGGAWKRDLMLKNGIDGVH